MVTYSNDLRYRSSSSSSQYQQSYRGSPSVAPSSSRSSTLRGERVRNKSRYSKSHAGVFSQTTSSSSGASSKNDFPIYSRSGDVEIILVSGKKESRYLLHKLYLAQSSGWFEEALGLGDGATVHSNGSHSSFVSVCQRVRFELEYSSKQTDLPMLVLKPTTSTSPAASPHQEHFHQRPPPPKPKPDLSHSLLRTVTNFSSLHLSHSESSHDTLLRIYDNLFRAFYNYPPLLDTTNLAGAYTDCKALLQLASAYDAISVIGPRVDHHLLGFGTRLWKQIAKYPPSYLKLGYQARSRAIFREALIHVVGQWPTGESQLRGQVPQDVLHLVEDKVDEIQEQRYRVESKLWRLTLTNMRGERVSPSVSWIDWLIMSLWRQWFAENTTPAPAGILKDSRTVPFSSSSSSAAKGGSKPPPNINIGRIFRLLGTGGNAYLNHDEVKRFMKLSPDIYSRENLKKAERRLDELKNLARDVVQPLTRCFLELGAKDGEKAAPYLTCVKVSEGEWPWQDE